MPQNDFLAVLVSDGLSTSYSSVEQIGLPDAIEPVGQASVFFDSCDRIRYKVDGENHVQELQYDTRGHVVETILYATPLTEVCCGDWYA